MALSSARSFVVLTHGALFQLALLCSLSFGCSDCDESGKSLSDAGSDQDASGGQSDGGQPFVPGERPELSSPGQIVPLLWGRVVVAHDDVSDTDTTFALDDPSQPAYQRFFSALDAACAADFTDMIAKPSGISLTPGCEVEGAYAARLHLCRAKAGMAFVAGDGAGLVSVGGAARLSLEGTVAGDALWSTTSTDSVVRASFALFVVAELREVIASASVALDPSRCEALSSAHASLLASDLRQASEELPNRTQIASGLLRQALTQFHGGAADGDATRIGVTRALNHSLLEEQKLYTGVPYATFSPIDASEENTREDRYPVLLAATRTSAERAATLIWRTDTRIADEHGKVESVDLLGVHFVAALRVHEPLLFGQLSLADVPSVLARLDLTADDLALGAQLLAAGQRVSGAPSSPRSSLDAPDALSVTHDARFAAQAYVNGITGARATRDDSDLASYAQRGLHHALDAARLAALHALSRAGLATDARAHLSVLASPTGELSGTLQVCEAADEVTVKLLLPASATGARYELWAGELGAACALDAACSDEPYRVAGDESSGFALSTSLATTRYYLTERRAGGDEKLRTVVASVNTRPLDRPSDERCFFEPLSAAMHEKMRSLHDRTPLPNVPRRAEPLTTGSELVRAPADPVSVTLNRSLAGVDNVSEALTIDLGEPFSAGRLAFERGLAALCDAPPALDGGVALRECAKNALTRASAHDCRANWARTAAASSTNRIALQDISVALEGEWDRLSLRLFAWQEAQRAIVAAADVIDATRCASQAPDAETAVASLVLVARLLAQARTELPELVARLEAEANAARAPETDPTRRRVLRSRGLNASSLASGRLFVSAPLSAYEPSTDASEQADLFDHALTRFPVVTRSAEMAEDTRAERLLRQSSLQPWLSDLTVQAGVLDLDALPGALFGASLATRLRARLTTLDPGTYAALPSDPSGFLTALGIDEAQLREAAVRMAQTAEIRGLSLLPIAASTPQLAVATAALFPAPNGIALAALSGGRLYAAADALPLHFALRGYYHVLTRVSHALSQTHGVARGSVLDALRAELRAQIEDSIVLEQRAPVTDPGAFAIERTLDANVSDAQAKAQTQLVFSDSGLTCALTGQVGGETCRLSDYVLDASALTLRDLPGASGDKRRIRLEGYRLASTGAWDLPHALELSRGRIYAIDTTGLVTRALAGVTLAPATILPVRHEVPRSNALDLSLLELLAFRAPGEGCAACGPRSVCETTRCELDLCVREPVVNGKTCGVGASCERGVCSSAGCGDGSRADGTDDVPYEACDDGNLDAGDGCSESCSPELRTLEPLVQEGWPAGPATSVGIDGLGQQLLVYTADALLGDNQLIRAAVLDAFGVQSGSERTLDASVPRVFIAEPCVAGLRDGGFAVVYGSPDIAGEGGIGVRIVSSDGGAGALLRVDDGNATVGSARVASVEEGFVVVWSERTGSALLSRVRARRFDAQGAAIGASFEVARAGDSVDQVEPTVASSLGQLLFAWSERDAEQGTALGVRGRRFSAFGSPVDGDAFDVSTGRASEPSLTRLGSDDYLMAWTSRDVDANGDIARRKIQRFGLPLAAGAAEPWVSGAVAQARPVVASLGADAVLAYQSGAPLPITGLTAQGAADGSAASALAAALANARERDISAVSTALGVWFVWSERQAQGRALFAYLLPAREQL